MKAKSFFIRFFSCFLVLSLLTSGILSYPQTRLSLNQQEQQDSSEDSQYQQEQGFEAVVHVGIVLDFAKFVLIKLHFLFFAVVPQEKSISNYFSVGLLPYFQNLYKSSILINAP